MSLENLQMDTNPPGVREQEQVEAEAEPVRNTRMASWRKCIVILANHTFLLDFSSPIARGGGGVGAEKFLEVKFQLKIHGLPGLVQSSFSTMYYLNAQAIAPVTLTAFIPSFAFPEGASSIFFGPLYLQFRAWISESSWNVHKCVTVNVRFTGQWIWTK